jgi:hypothetical protein
MALTDSLVSYWKLDEASGDALDAHGSNNLTDINTVGAAAGKINGARDFELDNAEQFSLADNADLSLGSDTDFTWSVWVWRESNTFLNAIISKHGGGLTDPEIEYVMYVSSGGDDRVYFKVGNNSSLQTVISTEALSLSTWHHVIVWHDSALDKLIVQVNNGTPTEAAWSGGTFNGNGTLRLGGSSGAVTHDGLIDEVGFWKRVLTSEERTQLYNGGNGLAYSEFSGGAATPPSPNARHSFQKLQGYSRR